MQEEKSERKRLLLSKEKSEEIICYYKSIKPKFTQVRLASELGVSKDIISIWFTRKQIPVYASWHYEYLKLKDKIKSIE